MRLKRKTIGALVVILFCLVILFQNSEPVSIRFLFWKISMSGILFLPLILAIGFVVGFVTAKLMAKRKTRLQTPPPETQEE